MPKISVATTNETHCVSIMKTSWFMLFREIIAVYSENKTKCINIPCGQSTVWSPIVFH
jgi:hypothetical protein